MPRTSLPPSLFDLAGLSSRGDRETLALSWRETFTAGDAREAAASQYEALGSQTKVAVQLSDPVEFVRTLVRLDGKVSALLLLAPALPRETVDVLMKSSGASVLLDDESRPPLHRFNLEDSTRVETHWLMTTSGTTGTPKVVEHHLSSLARTVKSTRGAGEVPHWGMLYDPSRFAGLQVVLQSLIGGGRLLIPNPEGPLSDRIAFLTANACTHLSATPSLWRKLLMLPSSADLPLRQITIGGEIAESRLLQALTHKFPAARITHLYASTEVGVGFAVNDRQAGFPLEFVSAGTGAVDLRIRDGLLWARPPKGLSASAASHMQIDEDGYVCTNDRVTIEGDRVYFQGRESSVVNVGGTKIQLEEVERIICEHPGVSDCVARPRPNPILGMVIAASIVPRDPNGDTDILKREVRIWCKARLQREAQPASIEIIQGVEITAAGKVARD